MDRRAYLSTLAGVSISGCISAPSSQATLYEKTLDTLDKERLGYGYDPYLGDEMRHWPMAYALIGSAEANRYSETTSSEALENASAAAEWLFQHRDRDGDGEVGWGVPFAWDAFSDGSTNPRHHKHTITTALAGHSLLDVVEHIPSLSSRTRQKYLKAVHNAVNPYLDQSMYNEYNHGICFWYSITPNDSYDVLNPSAMLAALLQRLSELKAPSVERPSVYSVFADHAISYLLNEAVSYNEGTVWWYYGKDMPNRSNIYNDGVHAAYIVNGLLTYAEMGGKYAERFDQAGMLDGLELFRADDSLLRYIDQNEPARLWGLGYLLHVLATFYPETRYIEFISETMRKYEREYGFSSRPNPPRQGFGAVRHTAHLLCGLSRYEF